LKQYVVLGCTHHHNVADRVDYHSNEIKFDINGRKPGIYGSKFFYRFGAEYEVNPSAKFLPKLFVGKDAILNMAWK